MKDLAKGFETFVDSTFQRIDGILVMKGPCKNTGKEGFYWCNEWYPDADAVRKAMNEVCSRLSLSLVNNKDI